MFEQSGTRQIGVRIPEGQVAGDRGEPNKIYNVAPLQPYAVEYTDEYGTKHVTVVYKAGDSVYFDVNGERWAAGLKRAASYITDAVKVDSSARKADVPTKDTVDVVSNAQNRTPAK